MQDVDIEENYRLHDETREFGWMAEVYEGATALAPLALPRTKGDDESPEPCGGLSSYVEDEPG